VTKSLIKPHNLIGTNKREQKLILRPDKHTGTVLQEQPSNLSAVHGNLGLQCVAGMP
jgi:hypothetical protein